MSMEKSVVGAIAILVLFTNALYAQDLSPSLERKLEQFPWYESGKLKDLPRLEPGRAQSLDRGNVPERKKQPLANSTNNTKPNPPQRPVKWDDSIYQVIVWITLMVAVLILVGVFLWFFFKTEFLSINKATGNSDQDTLDLQTRINQLPFQLDQQKLTGDFCELALVAAQQEDFARATMLLFSHLLLGLDRKGLVKLKKGKTNRQYLSELRNFQTLSAYFEQVMIPFEDSFFGDYPVEEQKFYECWNGLKQFQGELESVARTEVL